MSKLYKVPEAKLKEIIRQHFGLSQDSSVTFYCIKNANGKANVIAMVEVKDK